MEVQAGNQTAPSFAQPELWAFLDGLPERSRPVFLRGASHWGTEKAMVGAEERECKEADRTDLPERGMGGGGETMAGQGRGIAVERLEQGAAGSGATAGVAEQTGRGSNS